jgi:hypothetical protein
MYGILYLNLVKSIRTLQNQIIVRQVRLFKPIDLYCLEIYTIYCIGV